MVSENIECMMVALQLHLEVANTHSLEKEFVHHLCSAFSFWYDTHIPDEHSLFVNIYFPANNYIFHSDFNDIIKTFALHHGYYILHSKLIEMPYSDLVCLDA
ncbi:hypothetical protein OKE68_04465 [Riemerella anatipestifer]|uniref:Uncharacterized protein n=1 Tax=Riemerella anatipestifer TaxID=34085 RepID=A0AAP3EUW0_RIEAN|nr:hypothetical protein [Riemerella anatipestifer]MBO4233874.1 hypothetical protein [Riemerella anatipestifer]MBT0573759.1 hypothetical protein [Riemerella anatipestifer]MCU7568027.1 hypothetical protein [Riemerella anatipestifer]MCW0490048.1 hypothetical protein [Riemerella anatipestifer]MCW0510679.1 hypothetical protein [Riemerella anatipestifer]